METSRKFKLRLRTEYFADLDVGKLQLDRIKSTPDYLKHVLTEIEAITITNQLIHLADLQLLDSAYLRSRVNQKFILAMSIIVDKLATI